MINYITGDATDPQGDGPKLIAHICNDVGRWGSGFVVALSRRSPTPEREYRSWFHSGQWAGKPFELGQTQFTACGDPGVLVANMVAQRGIRHEMSAPPAVDYTALWNCLRRLGKVAEHMGASVHMPRIGCGLGGGDWKVVSELIDETLIAQDVPVTVYDLPGATI